MGKTGGLSGNKMIEPGTVLQQRYKIDKQIGQGGMGAVYVATDERFGSTVAIKETLCMDDNFRKAIEREARLLNSLKHSALPRVSDHFEENNGQFLVMEYIPGEDVASMIESDHASFTVEQILKWADQLLDALDYLHNQVIPVIHRDIKPQNLKINSRGEIILLDFGLAKGNPTDASHQTAAKSIFGYSRNYASLEQIQGTGTDPRSDLYSLAATLYHLLTRVAPEDALTRAMSVLSQNPDPLAPASSINSKIPRGVAGVLQKALDLNASERPASAAELRQMLRESDKYAHLTESVTVTASPKDAQVFAHATKLLSDESNIGTAIQADAKTEILPANLSQMTAVGTPSARGAMTGGSPSDLTTGPVQKSRGFGFAAGALSLLLVGGAIGGGVYFVKPSLFGIGPNVENVAEPSKSLPVPADSNVSVDANVSSIAIGANTAPGDTGAAAASVDVNRQALPSDKPAETTKSLKDSGTQKAKGQTNAGEVIEFQSDDPDIPPGGVTITQKDESGKITTMRVNPANRTPNIPQRPLNEVDPFPRVIDPSKLTPAQRRRMRNVIRNSTRQPVPVPPQPQP